MPAIAQFTFSSPTTPTRPDAASATAFAELAARIAHDLNNPSMVVRASLDYLQATLEPLLADMTARGDLPSETAIDVSEAITDSLRSMRRIAALADELSAFAALAPVEGPSR